MRGKIHSPYFISTLIYVRYSGDNPLFPVNLCMLTYFLSGSGFFSPYHVLYWFSKCGKCIRLLVGVGKMYGAHQLDKHGTRQFSDIWKLFFEMEIFLFYDCKDKPRTKKNKSYRKSECISFSSRIVLTARDILFVLFLIDVIYEFWTQESTSGRSWSPWAWRTRRSGSSRIPPPGSRTSRPSHRQTFRYLLLVRTVCLFSSLALLPGFATPPPPPWWDQSKVAIRLHGNVFWVIGFRAVLGIRIRIRPPGSGSVSQRCGSGSGSGSGFFPFLT